MSPKFPIAEVPRFGYWLYGGCTTAVDFFDAQGKRITGAPAPYKYGLTYWAYMPLGIGKIPSGASTFSVSIYVLSNNIVGNNPLIIDAAGFYPDASLP